VMLPLPAYSGVPSGTSAVLDMTADFAPLLKTGLLVAVGIIILAVVTAIRDSWWEPRKAQQTPTSSTPESDFPRAA
jgi:hypothetical protein